MSDQATIVAVSSRQPAAFANALGASGIFPVVDATWREALDAVARMQPAAVVASALPEDLASLELLAKRLSAKQPYVPLIVIDPVAQLPAHAIPLIVTEASPFDRLGARLRNALRVRTLHATVMRRLTADNLHRVSINAPDPLDDATVMLIGRGGSYPAMSVALGERVGVVGALSIEAAAKHLNARDLDGIVIGDGFSARVVDAFLTVLTEDPRFRNLPVVVTMPGLAPGYDLANLEMVASDAVADTALPLVRQHAFEARLGRTLRSIESDGLLDPATGLLTTDAFERDLATAVYQTQARGGGLCAARFSFDGVSVRAQRDAARIISRLMRRMDFGALQADGAITVVFTETNQRNAQMIARRLSSVMRHTMHGPKRDARNDPHVTVIAMTPNDSAKSLMGRLLGETSARAAS